MGSGGTVGANMGMIPAFAGRALRQAQGERGSGFLPRTTSSGAALRRLRANGEPHCPAPLDTGFRRYDGGGGRPFDGLRAGGRLGARFPPSREGRWRGTLRSSCCEERRGGGGGGSRLRGNDEGGGGERGPLCALGTGFGSPRSEGCALVGVPAFAGTTGGGVGSCESGNVAGGPSTSSGERIRSARLRWGLLVGVPHLAPLWIPAFAGTTMGAGVPLMGSGRAEG